MTEPTTMDRTQNITPRPGPRQRQRQRQPSTSGIFSTPINTLFSSPAPPHGKQTRSTTAAGLLAQPTPIRKTPGKPLLDPASPFVETSTTANAFNDTNVTMMTPVKHSGLQDFSILTPMHFSSNGDLNNPGLGMGLTFGMGMGMSDQSSSIVYVEPGVAVATPEHGTTGMVYPGAWMGSGGVGMDMNGLASQDGTGYAQAVEHADGTHLQGSAVPETRRYPTTLGAGRMPTTSFTPTHARVASSISGWDGDMVSSADSPTLGQYPGSTHSRSVSSVPSLTSSRPKPASNRGVKRLRQVTHDGSLGRTPPTSHHVASRSVSSVASSNTSQPLGNPLTFRPLARMPARTISSTSSMSASTASWDHDGSPVMYPTYMPHGQFEAYHHRRNYSNMSGMTNLTVATPALEYSMESPALRQGQNAMLTPVMGQEGGFYYSQLQGQGQVPFYHQLGGLAIRTDGGQPQYAQHVQEQSYVTPEPQLEAQFINQDSTQYQDYSATAEAPDFDIPPLSAHSMDGTGTYTLVATPATPSVLLNPYVAVEQPAGWPPSGTYHQPAVGYPTYPMFATSSAVAGPSNGFRHVSSSAVPEGYYASLAPAATFPTPRTVSDGYTSTFPSYPQYYTAYTSRSTSMQHSQSFESLPPDPSSSQRTPVMSSEYGGLPLLGIPEEDLASPVTEGGDRSAKRNKVKHPTVGKRLRPGPKPKPKTPKKGDVATFSASDPGNLPFDPFVESQSAVQDPTTSSQPAATTTELIEGDTAPAMSSASQAIDGAIPEAISNIPRSYLESCYTSFIVRDIEHGGAPAKRYQCNIDDCMREFPRKSAIHSHIQTHLEDKPFVCPDPECNAAFVRQHDLRRHVRIHSGTKPFPCPCGKGFARGDALMRHRQRGICIGSTVPMRKSPRKKGSSSDEA